VQSALFDLRAEIEETEKRISEANEVNASFGGSIDELERQREHAIERRAEEEKVFALLQADYKAILGSYSKMLEALDSDPFDSDRFAQFVTQMAEKEWDPETVRIAAQEHEKLSTDLTNISQHIDQQEATESEMSARIALKRDRIAALEDQLRLMAEQLGESPVESPRELVGFTDEAPHLEIGEELAEGIKDGETAVLVHFGDFTLDEAVIGDEPSDLFLRMYFLDTAGVPTDTVDARSGCFNATVKFECKNDVVLRTFIEKSAVQVQLCRSSGDEKTEIGKTSLNLRPIAQGVSKFSATTQFWVTDGTVVGDVNYEAAIVHPLFSDNA
jgi:hypothetical protein